MVKIITTLLLLFIFTASGKSKVEIHLSKESSSLSTYPFYEPRIFNEKDFKTIENRLSKSLTNAKDDYVKLIQGIAINKRARAIHFDWLKKQDLTSKNNNFYILYGIYITLTTSKNLEKDEIKKMKIFVRKFKSEKRRFQSYKRIPNILEYLFEDLKLAKGK